MDHLLNGFFVVSLAAALIAVSFWAMDGDIIAIVVAVVLWSAFVGLVLHSTEQEEAKGPCVKYETQMHYNAATKTVMPARVCVLRGEWED